MKFFSCFTLDFVHKKRRNKKGFLFRFFHPFFFLSISLSLFYFSAFHDNAVRILFRSENRLQGLLIVLMEELLLSERFNLLIQKIQKRRIALRNRGGNGIVVS